MDKKLEKMFRDLINEYGSNLPTGTERSLCRKVIKDLKAEEYSPEEIYWILWNLGDRSLLHYKPLVYNDIFRIEAMRIVSNARKYHDDYKYNYNDMFDAMMMAGLSDEEIANVEDKEQAFIDYYLKPTLSITKQTYREQREAEIQMLKEQKIYRDFKEIPQHPYTNYEMDTEIRLKMDIQRKVQKVNEIMAKQKEPEVVTLYVDENGKIIK